MELSNRIEEKKARLIDQLLANGIYKTTDQRHLYDAPLHVLEDEYKLVVEEPNS